MPHAPALPLNEKKKRQRRASHRTKRQSYSVNVRETDRALLLHHSVARHRSTTPLSNRKTSTHPHTQDGVIQHGSHLLPTACQLTPLVDPPLPRGHNPTVPRQLPSELRQHRLTPANSLLSRPPTERTRHVPPNPAHPFPKADGIVQSRRYCAPRAWAPPRGRQRYRRSARHQRPRDPGASTSAAAAVVVTIPAALVTPHAGCLSILNDRGGVWEGCGAKNAEPVRPRINLQAPFLANHDESIEGR